MYTIIHHTLQSQMIRKQLNAHSLVDWVNKLRYIHTHKNKASLNIQRNGPLKKKTIKVISYKHKFYPSFHCNIVYNS